MKGILKGLLGCVVRVYQICISPYTSCSCRFIPCCSEYARQALDQHSLSRAVWLIFKRLSRCHPWGGQGVDMVPENPSHVKKVKNPYVRKIKVLSKN